MNKDIDGLDWLREIRRKMAADCHYYPKIMGDYYRRIQKQYEHRIVKNPYDDSERRVTAIFLDAPRRIVVHK